MPSSSRPLSVASVSSISSDSTPSRPGSDGCVRNTHSGLMSVKHDLGCTSIGFEDCHHPAPDLSAITVLLLPILLAPPVWEHGVCLISSGPVGFLVGSFPAVFYSRFDSS